MPKEIKKPALDLLFQAVMTLENEADCYAFFGDLCTIPELNALAQRLQVAQMLQQKMVYSEIVERTGASSATISRVNRSLQYGNDGYLLALSRMGEESGDV